MEAVEIDIPTADGVISARHFAATSTDFQSATGRPCVVMAHGIGATQDCGLQSFATGFSELGADAITFDYRHFGQSSGEPRQLVSLERQLADYHSVIAYARRTAGVDPDRIVAWGVSLAGGHVIRVGVTDPRLAGIIALTPAVDGVPVMVGMLREHGIGYMLRVSARGVQDAIAGLRGRSPLLLPIVGEPGQPSALNSPGAVAGMRATAGPLWRNEFAARLVLAIGAYRPGTSAAQVAIPALVQIGDHDRSAPPAAATAAATRMHATVHHYPCDHFDVYPGALWHDHVLRDQLQFLGRVIAPTKQKVNS